MTKLHYTESLYYDIEKTARVMKLLALQLFNKLKFTIHIDEFYSLDVISMHNGICQRDLAKYILKDRANTGRILNSLEEKGLIIRNNDTKNNRLVRKIEITELGKDVLEQIDDKLNKYLMETVEPFREAEIKNFHSIVKKFRLGMENLLELNI